MAKSPRSGAKPPAPPCDPQKFDQVHQIGGIRTARFDYPESGGSPGCRVAMVNTGSPLRFTVALDRGGDIVEAFYSNISLAYLTANGYKPPSHAYHREMEWLAGWPGGLVTSCGPQYIGGARMENGQAVSLHGHHSNTPAALLAIGNPDPRGGDLGMHLDMKIRDTRMFGPHVEVRRRIRCTLGQPVIHLHDEVINLGNQTVPHNWLYHVNPGYPLLDRGARFVYRGKVTGTWDRPAPLHKPKAALDFNRLKVVPGALPEHDGTGERGVLLEVGADRKGIAHTGLVNRKLGLGLELSFAVRGLPRLANWQHFGAAGSYVTALEPFNGSPMGTADDDHPLAEQWLKAGQRKQYDLTLTVHAGTAGIKAMLAHDGELTPM